MQPLSELIIQPRQESPEPSQSVTLDERRRALGLPMERLSRGNLRESHFDRLWLRMAGTFGHRWTSSYGETPHPAWVDGLSDMSVEDLRLGLEACLSWPGEWPPSLVQFRRLCRPRVEEAHRFFVRESVPDEVRARRWAVGRAHLAAFRESERLQAWLREHEGRRCGELGRLLEAVRVRCGR